MITFSNLGNLGRLGNQLFQYAAVRSLSITKGFDLALPDPIIKTWHGQDCLLKEFNIPENLFAEIRGLRYSYKEKDALQYDPSFWQIPDGTDLVGFFQSTLYFKDQASIIKKELTPKETHLASAREYITVLKEKYNKPIISVHIRRGDLTSSINKEHYTSMYDKKGDYFAYLNKALELFPDCHYLVFTGGNRSEEGNSEDIKWCKDNLNINAEYSNGTTMQDFCRIMMCDHSVLSPATSFGWWAGYLSASDNKKVVAPNNYHPDLESFNHREGFYPEEFIVL